MNKIRQKASNAIKAGKSSVKTSTRKVKASVLPADTEIDPGLSFSDDDRLSMIAEAAYIKAENRGFIVGDEQACWLEAELEIDALIATGSVNTQQRPATLQ